uniref:Uncharacterized protein n=1 Tax=Anopheles epiroticus TaxID=199890 RepID=A0A182PIP6_9DIPT
MEQKGINNNGRVAVMDNHQPSSPVDDRQQAAMFDELAKEIGKIDAYAETIELTYHLRKFAELFRRRISSEQQLNDLFKHLNEEALSDNGFAIQFALVFASRQLDDVAISGKNIRNAMITTLQHNFLSIDRLKQEGGERFYNSIVLLGEYYNRKMMTYGNRIKILGESLLLLLTSELEQEINKICRQASTHRLDPYFAKVLLAQITLNGAVWKEEHRKEANDLMYTMRKALIVIPNLCSPAKSFLLMALDMYNGMLGQELVDKLYGKYLSEPTSKVTEENTSTVVNGDVQNASIEPLPVTHNQSANVEKNAEKQSKKGSERDAPVPKPKGSKSNTSTRSTGASKPANQNLTTNDKENKRRSTQTKTAPAQKISPKASAGRSIRVHEDGNIVATITRDTPASPTKKQPSAAAQPSPPGVTPRSPTKKGLSPRMEKLATLPKITITCATPSPKRTQNKPSAVSPRAVLGPSIAKQNPHQPPKSPTHGREGQYGMKHASDASRGRQDRYVRGSAKATPVVVADVRSPVDIIPHTESVDHRETAYEEPNNLCLSPIVSPEKYDDWGHVAPQPEPHRTVECTSNERESLNKEVISSQEDVDKSTSATAAAPKSKTKVKPSYFREENVENLSWDVLIPLEDESPQKVNPHTKSFLSFLASE